MNEDLEFRHGEREVLFRDQAHRFGHVVVDARDVAVRDPDVQLFLFILPRGLHGLGVFAVGGFVFGFFVQRLQFFAEALEFVSYRDPFPDAQTDEQSDGYGDCYE